MNSILGLIRRLSIGTALALAVGVAAIAFFSFPLNAPPQEVIATTATPTIVPVTSIKQAPGLPWFEDVTSVSGIDFQHFNPALSQNYIQETMGSGLGWIDYDNDGWLDLFCVQDGPIFPETWEGPLPTSKLYRNQGDGTFSDVTSTVGLDRTGFGMGCAVGDFDNDSFDDLVVTYWKGVVLYHNQADDQGGRHFVDISMTAGLHNPHWATSCGWGDIDNDGDLDLYVCNYNEVDLANYPTCVHQPGNLRISCAPWWFPTVSHRLYQNNNDGTFVDATEAAGIADASPAPGLGVVLADLDNDGWLDIYVANDARPAFLFHNQGGGRFEEQALYSGCALGGNGENIAGMGVDAADISGNGLASLFVTNFHFTPNALYLNEGDLRFRFGTHSSGLGGLSIDRLGFGTLFCDVDLDGRLDLAVANGHVERHAEQVFNVPYAQRSQLLLGIAGGSFREVSSQAGTYFQESYVGRGLARADYDNDGRPDLAFSHNGGPIKLLQNRTETANGWLSLELIGDGQRSNRNAIGARVEIESTAGRQVRFINGGGSYLSASERRLLVGLGPAQRAEVVTVHWPSGLKQTFHDLEGQRWWRLFEGEELPRVVELSGKQRE